MSEKKGIALLLGGSPSEDGDESKESDEGLQLALKSFKKALDAHNWDKAAKSFKAALDHCDSSEDSEEEDEDEEYD